MLSLIAELLKRHEHIRFTLLISLRVSAQATALFNKYQLGEQMDRLRCSTFGAVEGSNHVLTRAEVSEELQELKKSLEGLYTESIQVRSAPNGFQLQLITHQDAG